MTTENLVKASLDEIQKILNTTSVIGEAKTIEGVTVIPLVSNGFFFGTISATGKGEVRVKGEAEAGTSGGGVGIRPVAVIIIDKTGARVEPIMGAISGAVEKVAEKVAEKIPDVVDVIAEKRKKE